MATIYKFEEFDAPVMAKPSLGEGWYQRVDIPLLVQVDAPQVPLPPSSILLFSALLGLAVLKRKGDD